MTTDQLVDAWRAWLADNPDQPVGVLLDRLARIAVEARRPSVQPQRRRMNMRLR